MFVLVSDGLQLIEVRWDVAKLIQILWSNLWNVQINQVTIVCVDFIELIFSQLLSVEIPLNVNVFVWKNHWRVSVSITWSFLVIDLKVLFSLVFVNAEVEVWSGFDFLVDVAGKSLSFFLVESFLELKEINFLSHQLCDLVLDVLQVVMIVILDLRNLSKDIFLLVDVSETGEPFSFSGFLGFLFSEMLLRGLELIDVLLVVSVFVSLLGFSPGSGCVGLQVSLDFSCTESSLALVQDLWQITLSASSFKEHIWDI